MRVCMYILTGLLLLQLNISFSQNIANNDNISSNSNTSSVATSSENLATGSMTSSIPIYELDLENNMSIPIALTYSSGNGLPVKSRNSWVGMGWHLSGQYAISRSIRGADDFQFATDGALYHEGFYLEPLGPGNVPTISTYALGIDDSEPDMFTVNLIGQQITFYLSKVTNQLAEWKTIPANADVDIQFTLGDYETSYTSGININRYNSSFVITDGLGYKYYFGTSDYEEYSNTYNAQHFQTTSSRVRLFANKWYLEKIETPFTNQVVTYTYEDDYYSYLSGASAIEKSIAVSNQNCPNSTHYSDYEYNSNDTYVKGKRLSSIQYQNTEIEFIASTINRGHNAYINANHRSKMLDAIKIKQNGYCIKKYALEYANVLASPEDDGFGLGYHIYPSYNNYFLDKFIELPCTSNLNDGTYDNFNSYTHRFSYIQKYGLQGIGNFAFDYWGYYNGANDNQSPIPRLFDLDGDPETCAISLVGDRRPDFNYAQVGLLDSIFNPYGGFTAFEYESNEALTSNSIQQNIVWSNTGNINSYDFIYDYSCDEPPYEREVIITYSELEFEYEQENTALLKFENLVNYWPDCFEAGPAERKLYMEVSGSYQFIPTGGGGSSHIDMSGMTSGNYKIVFASRAETIVKLTVEENTPEMAGGGVRLKSKHESDNDIHDYDDITTHYTYGDGHWGYNFLPSVYGQAGGILPIIPEIEDGNIYFAPQQFVISTLNRSVLSTFVAPVYYEDVTVTQTNVPGSTTYTYSVPENFDGSRNKCAFYNNPDGTTPYVNQDQIFINGSMTSYNMNNGMSADKICYDEFTSPFYLGQLLKTETYDSNDQLVFEQINEYEEVNSGEHIYGVICERYVQNREYGFFFNQLQGVSWTRISRAYRINTNSSRLQRTITTIDGITRIVEYDYVGNRNIISQKTSYVEGLNSDAIQETYRYLEVLPSSVRQELQNRNCVKIPFQIETTKNGQLISGNKTMYQINNNQIVKVLDYIVVGGQFIPETKYHAWDNLGRPTASYNVKLNGNEFAPVTGTNDSNFDYPTITSYSGSNPYQIESITRRLRGISYTYYPDSQLESISDADGEVTTINYDELGRRSQVISENGLHILEAEYFIDPISSNSYVKHTTTVDDPTIVPHVSFEYFDGLKRKTSKKIEGFNADGSDLILESLEYTNSGRAMSMERPGFGAIALKYTNSPLQRPAGDFKSHNETFEILETYITYDANELPITIVGPGSASKTYPAYTLTKETQTDSDGRQTSQYKDDNNQVVRMVKYMNGNELNTDTYYNNLGQVVFINSPNNEIYEFEYSPTSNLLLSKSVPGTNQNEQYWYDDLGRNVLAKSSNGTTIAYVFDPYERVIKSGIYKPTTLPSVGQLFTEDIPDSDMYIGNEKIFYGSNGESSFLEQENIAILGNFASLNALTEINGTNPLIQKNYVYDNRNRLYQSTSNTHFGAIDQFEYSYDNENKIRSTTRIHTDPNGTSYDFIYENHYDERSRNVGLSVNGQRLSKVDYDQYNRIQAKHLHESGPNSYTQSLNYLYDGYGRVININDIDNFQYADCASDRYCNIIIELADEQGVTINDLREYNGQSETTISGIAFPYNINQGSVASINSFLFSLENWLNTNGYVYDDVYYNYVDGGPQIIISQSNAPLSTAVIDNGTKDVQRANCCSQIDQVDVFAQRITYDGTLISSNEWQASCGPLHSYHYHYDDLGRLSFANYSHRENSTTPFIGDGLDIIDANYSNANQSGIYSSSYTYDDVGNFNSLTRNGINSSNPDYGLLIDDLSYTYEQTSSSPNYGRLLTVDDLTNNSLGFNGASNQTSTLLSSSFNYDNSGSLIENTGKDMLFNYNYLNNPTTISNNGNSVEMYYDANGNVIQKEIIGSKSMSQYFAGDLEYRDNDLFALNHAEGRIKISALVNSSLDLSHEYVVRDYKGNPRVRFTEKLNDDIVTQDEILSVNNYYPFGLKWDTTPDPGTQTNFNEYQNMDWLEAQNVYLTNHRVLDPEIGRWLQVDPLAVAATTHTPYGCMALNPVMFTDEEGDIAVGTVLLIASLVATAVEGIKKWHNIRSFNAAAAMNNTQQMNGGAVMFEWLLVTGISYAISYGIGGNIKVPAISEAKKFGQMALRTALKYSKHFTIKLTISATQNAIKGNGLYSEDNLSFKELIKNVAISAALSTTMDLATEKTFFPKFKKTIYTKITTALSNKTGGGDNTPTTAESKPKEKNPFKQKWSDASKLKKSKTIFSVVRSAWKITGTLGSGWYYATYQDEPGSGQNPAEYEHMGSISFKHKWGTVIDAGEVPSQWGWTNLPSWANFLINIP